MTIASMKGRVGNATGRFRALVEYKLPDLVVDYLPDILGQLIEACAAIAHPSLNLDDPLFWSFVATFSGLLVDDYAAPSTAPATASFVPSPTRTTCSTMLGPCL